MKTPSTPKTAPVKKTNTMSKKSPAQKSLVKAASTARGAAKPITNSLPQADEIAARAYKIWQQQGCPEGHEEQHWCQAEQEVLRDGFHAHTPLS
jgi:hypothetical protein